ncbi:MAG: hypothetical protein Q9190_004329 [Brigantiaea leucoxantha]
MACILSIWHLECGHNVTVSICCSLAQDPQHSHHVNVLDTPDPPPPCTECEPVELFLSDDELRELERRFSSWYQRGSPASRSESAWRYGISPSAPYFEQGGFSDFIGNRWGPYDTNSLSIGTQHLPDAAASLCQDPFSSRDWNYVNQGPMSPTNRLGMGSVLDRIGPWNDLRREEQEAVARADEAEHARFWARQWVQQQRDEQERWEEEEEHARFWAAQWVQQQRDEREGLEEEEGRWEEVLEEESANEEEQGEQETDSP